MCRNSRLDRCPDTGFQEVCRKGLRTLARKMLIAFDLVWFDWACRKYNLFALTPSSRGAHFSGLLTIRPCGIVERVCREVSPDVKKWCNRARRCIVTGPCSILRVQEK